VTTDAICEIARLRTEAKDLLDVLSREQFLPDEDEVTLARRDEVLQLANELHQAAKDPITLGIVGAFSSGKSMLLSTLLGHPGLLPTQQRPTTGNVTVLHLLPGQPGAGTAFESEATVLYMNRHELTECVGYMLDRFAAQFTDTFPSADVSMLNDCDPVNKDWRELETWCRARLWGGASRSKDLRQIVAELMAIRDAQLCAASLLGQSVQVADELIRKALDLGDEQPVPDAFPERKFRPSVTLDSVRRDGDDLRVTFSLIKRVTYRVRVDPEVWRLDSLRDENEVVLLDFPGLTAGRSALRDEYLSRNELHDIHTITVIIDADKPGTDVPFKFYAMMERHDRHGIGRDPDELRDSILVVGNRFDMIAPPTAPSGGPLGIGELRKLSQRLDGLCIKASDLVEHRDDKIRLASSIAAISLSGEVGGYASMDAGEEGERVRAMVFEARPGIAAWGALAERLQATDPAEPWGAALAEFATDGGMAGVRMLIEQHARDHGIENKLRSMRRIHARMWTALGPLARALRRHRPVPTPEQEAQQRIGELLEDFRSRHRRVAEALRELADPLELVRPDDGVPLVAGARDDLVTRVMRWPEWQLILQRADHGFVGKSQEYGDDAEYYDEEERQRFGKRTVGNETTATFLPAYQRELTAAVQQGRKSLAEWVKDWIQRQNEQLGDLAERFNDPEIKSLLEPGLERIAPDFGGDDLPWMLSRLTGLSWLEPQVAQATGTALAQAEISEGYPLYVDRALPWHSRVPERDDEIGDKLTRHQFYVLRLQRQLASGIADALTKHMADDLDSLRTMLDRRLQRYWRSIPGAADVRAMFPPEPAAGTAAAGSGGNGGGPPAGPSPLLDFIAEREAR
jgi:hypothetical protein